VRDRAKVCLKSWNRTLPKITAIRGLAANRVISKDKIKISSLDEVAVGRGKLETGSDIPESTPTPGAPTYRYVEDLYGLAKIGEDELMDSDFNLQNILVDSFSRAIAEAEDVPPLGEGKQEEASG